MFTICLWPDGTWCEKEDLHEMLDFMSDDYETLYLEDLIQHYIDNQWTKPDD